MYVCLPDLRTVKGGNGQPAIDTAAASKLTTWWPEPQGKVCGSQPHGRPCVVTPLASLNYQSCMGR